MATAFEGEAIVSIVQAAGNFGVGGGTIYACPAGKYARVQLRELSCISGTPTVIIGGSSIALTAGQDVGVVGRSKSGQSATNTGDDLTDTIFMSSGETIATTGGGGASLDFDVIALEFTNP